MKNIFGIIALCLGTLLSTFSQAKETQIITDRPDAAEASVTVGQWKFQSEHGVSFGYDNPAGPSVKNYSFPTLLRFGILDPLEIRLETEIAAIQSSGGNTESGFTDFDLGAKWHLHDQAEFFPSLGLLFHLTIPVGKDAFSSNVVVPTFKVLADWELPADFGLGTNAGFDVPAREGGDKFARFLYAAALSHGLFIEPLAGFVEFSGSLPTVSGKTQEHFFDAGFTWLFGKSIQADISGQIGLNDDAQDFALGTGVSILW